MTKTAHYITTGLFSAMIMLGVGMYLTQHDMASESFAALGYPTYLVYVLAVVKTLGVIAIWVPRYPSLRSMAYAGFFYELMLAVLAHVMVADGNVGGAAVALALLGASYVSGHKLARDAETSLPMEPIATT